MYKITKTYYLFDPETEADKIDEFERTTKGWSKSNYVGWLLYTIESREQS